MDRLAKMIADGCDLRLWCFRCGRGDARPVPVEMLERVLRGATCAVCGKRDQVGAYPARSSFKPSTNGATDLVAHFFHAMRSAGKKRR